MDERIVLAQAELVAARAVPAGRLYRSWKPESPLGRRVRLERIARCEKVLRAAQRARGRANARAKE